MTERVTQLIALLLDKDAPFSARDDAGIDLGSYDDESAFSALFMIACDTSEDEVLVETCGASIAQIWKRSGGLDSKLMTAMRLPARREVLAAFGSEACGRGTRGNWGPGQKPGSNKGDGGS
jgi:hypothetical protein